MLLEVRRLDEVYRSQQGIRNLGAFALALVTLSVLPAAAALMMAIGVLAAIVPARRALRVNPTETLRNG